jgi:hypothetical protein
MSGFVIFAVGMAVGFWLRAELGRNLTKAVKTQQRRRRAPAASARRGAQREPQVVVVHYVPQNRP